MSEDTAEDREARKENERLQKEYLASQLADDLMRCDGVIAESIIELGYRQLRITIEDVKTGEIVDCLQTYRRPGGHTALLCYEVKKLAKPPDDLLDTLRAFVPEIGREVTGREIIDKQLMGGRPPGKWEEKHKRYRVLAQDWYQTEADYIRRLTKGEVEDVIRKEEFVKERREKYADWWPKLSVATLNRALREFPESTFR